MHIACSVSPSGRYLIYTFPFKIGIVNENRWWRPGDTKKLTGDYPEEIDQLMVENKFLILEELIYMHSPIPIERIDICTKNQNEIGICITADDKMAVRRINNIISKAFGMEVIEKNKKSTSPTPLFPISV